MTALRRVAVVGPTASGKSAVALHVAQQLGDVELLSIDSMQVYRGMDIGTAKPTAAERALVPHHLLDLVDADHDFTVAEFQRAYRRTLDDIAGRAKRALLVGGMVMLGDKEFRPVTSACWDAGRRLEEMDRDGVDLQVMCATPVLFAYARPACCGRSLSSAIRSARAMSPVQSPPAFATQTA